MAKRRSLGDALTPEQDEFLRGDRKKPRADPRRPEKKPSPQTRSKLKTEKENPAMNKPAFQEHITIPEEPHVDGAPVPALVGLNTRIEARLSNGLLRASMERRIRRLTMAKVQDIVGEALSDWLKKHGYLN